MEDCLSCFESIGADGRPRGVHAAFWGSGGLAALRLSPDRVGRSGVGRPVRRRRAASGAVRARRSDGAGLAVGRRSAPCPVGGGGRGVHAGSVERAVPVFARPAPLYGAIAACVPGMVGWGAPWCQVSVRPRYPAPISKSGASMTGDFRSRLRISVSRTNFKEWRLYDGDFRSRLRISGSPFA